MKGLRFASFLVLVSIRILLGVVACQTRGALERFGIKKLSFETGPGQWWVAPHEDIFVLDSQNSTPRKVAEGLGAVWSPDGQKLAYCVHEGWGTKHIVFGQIQVVRADGSAHKQLTNLQNGTCPKRWSPDGRMIAFNQGIIELSDDGENVVTVVSSPGGGLPSPDWKYRLYWEAGARGSGGSIWVSKLDGTDARKVIEDKSYVVGLSWSPDSQSIVFSSGRQQKDRFEVFRIKLDGSALETLATDKKLSFHGPTISPDGKYLVVAANEHGSTDFVVMLLDLPNRSKTVLAHGHNPQVVWDKSPTP